MQLFLYCCSGQEIASGWVGLWELMQIFSRLQITALVTLWMEYVPCDNEYTLHLCNQLGSSSDTLLHDYEWVDKNLAPLYTCVLTISEEEISSDDENVKCVWLCTIQTRFIQYFSYYFAIIVIWWFAMQVWYHMHAAFVLFLMLYFSTFYSATILIKNLSPCQTSVLLQTNLTKHVGRTFLASGKGWFGRVFLAFRFSLESRLELAKHVLNCWQYIDSWYDVSYFGPGGQTRW